MTSPSPLAPVINVELAGREWRIVDVEADDYPVIEIDAGIQGPQGPEGPPATANIWHGTATLTNGLAQVVLPQAIPDTACVQLTYDWQNTASNIGVLGALWTLNFLSIASSNPLDDSTVHWLVIPE